MAASVWIIVSVAAASVAVRGQISMDAPYKCLPAKPNHTDLTGEALYQQEIKDYATWIKALDDVAAANPNALFDNTTSSSLLTILKLQQGSDIVADVATGKSPITPANCQILANTIADAMTTIESHANDEIVGWTCTNPVNCCMELTGEARYQYGLQQLGQTLVVTLTEGSVHANDANPGKWLSTLINVTRGISYLHSIRNQPMGSADFNSTACISTVGVVTQAFAVALSSLQDTSPY